jgi:hypothetical protein
MIRKTALMAGVAGALMMAAPALSQETIQDPATDPMTQTEPMTEAEVEAEASVAPGAEVKASDGASLGILEGAGVDAAGQQTLQIRGSDGQLREAPIAGAALDNGAVVLTWTEAEFEAAPAVSESTSNVSGSEAPLPGDEAEREPSMDAEAIPEAEPIDEPAAEKQEPQA